jgi:hypothetical protein
MRLAQVAARTYGCSMSKFMPCCSPIGSRCTLRLA